MINKKISNFKHCFYNLQYPPTFAEYKMMNRKRMDIKSLLALQEQSISHQSYRRRTFYYLQLEKFKLIYTRWKRYTYYIFLMVAYDVPKHLCTALKWFMRSDRKNFFVMKNGNL